MILLTLALLGTAPICTDTRQICRACTIVHGKQVCSTPGIACQPLKRVCTKPETAANGDGRIRGRQASAAAPTLGARPTRR